MSSTLAQLTAGQTTDAITAAQIAALAPDFPVTTWRDGDVAKTLVKIDAQALSDLQALVAAIAAGGHTGLAAGAWLDLIATNFYNLTRNAAVGMIGSCMLTDGGAGPTNIAVRQLWLAAGSLRYTNTSGGTLTQNGSLTLTWAAEVPGAAYNGPGPLSLITSLPGVTVGTMTVLQSGTDAETDVALATRCRGRWAALGTGSPAAAYDSWARTASAEVTRTKVQQNGTTAGQVDVYLAGAAGPVSGAALAAVAAYLTPLVPLCSVPNVVNCAATTITVTGTVNVAAASLSAASAQVLLNIVALQQAIGIAGTAYFSAIIEQLMSPFGVRDCTIAVNGGSANVALGSTAVPVFDVTGLVFVGV